MFDTDFIYCVPLVCSCLDGRTDAELVELVPADPDQDTAAPFRPSPEEIEIALQIITALARGGMSYGRAILLTVLYADAIEKQIFN